MDLPQVFIDALIEAFEFYQAQGLRQILIRLGQEGITDEEAEKLQEAYTAMQALTVEGWTVNLLLPTIDKLLASKRRVAVVGALAVVDEEIPVEPK